MRNCVRVACRLIVADIRAGNWPRQAHIQGMEASIKIALLAGLMVLTMGVIPDRRSGAVIAIGTCVVAAVVLHFVAP